MTGWSSTSQAGAAQEPPEELRSAEDPLGGRYLRHPEPANRRTWTYRWVTGQATAVADRGVVGRCPASGA